MASTDEERGPLLATEEASEHRQLNSSQLPCTPDGPDGPGNDDGDDDDDDDDNHVAYNVSTARLAIMLFVGNMGVFICSIDTTILGTLLGPVSASLADFSIMPYLTTSFLVAVGATAALCGRLSNVFGRGPTLAAGFALIGVASLACGLAPSKSGPKDSNPLGVGIFIAGRLLAGVGCGPCFTIVSFLNADLVSERSRGLLIGVSGATWGLGLMFGAIIGGWISDRIGWRFAFLLHVPVCIVCSVVAWWSVNLPAKASRSKASKLARIDFSGAMLTMTWFVLLVVPLNAGGVIVPWSHPAIWLTLLASVAVAVALVRVEQRAKNPIIPIDIVINGSITTPLLATAINSGLLTQALFSAPLYYQVVLGDSASQAGQRTVVFGTAFLATNIAAGYTIKAWGRYVPVGVVSMAAAAAGFGILTLSYAASPLPVWVVCVALGLMGAGSAPLINVTALAIAASVGPGGRLATALAMMQMCREIGSTLSMSVSTAVLENLVRTRLWERYGDRPGAAADIEGILESVVNGRALPDGWAMEDVVEAFTYGFAGAWGVGLVPAVVGVGIVCMMKEQRLRDTLH